MPANEREAELNGARRTALLQRQPAITVLPRSRFGLGILKQQRKQLRHAHMAKGPVSREIAQLQN